MALYVLSTTEYRQDAVEAAYQHILGRGADHSGLNYRGDTLQAGATDQRLNAQIGPFHGTLTCRAFSDRLPPRGKCAALGGQNRLLH